MDKITRILLLFSKLSHGEKISKPCFCLETDSLARTFDRDIEDIRLYLSEFFCAEELVYNRQENVYYLSRTQRHPLKMMEYLFIERVLLDTGVLRNDEMDGLLTHLAENTENVTRNAFHGQECLKSYIEPIGKMPILKMNGDLQTVIVNKSVIEIQYIKSNGSTVNRVLIPCMVKYDLGYLYLIAYRQGEDYPHAAYYRLDRIYSFSILRAQTSEEICKVEQYKSTYASGIIQMYGGDFIEITIECHKKYYPYVYDKFRKISVNDEKSDVVILRVKAFEDGFVKWILSQPPECIHVLGPESLRRKINMEAQKLLEKYMEVQ